MTSAPEKTTEVVETAARFPILVAANLSPDQSAVLRAYAKINNLTLAELIRRLIDDQLGTLVPGSPRLRPEHPSSTPVRVESTLVEPSTRLIRPLWEREHARVPKLVRAKAEREAAAAKATRRSATVGAE